MHELQFQRDPFVNGGVELKILPIEFELGQVSGRGTKGESKMRFLAGAGIGKDGARLLVHRFEALELHAKAKDSQVPLEADLHGSRQVQA